MRPRSLLLCTEMADSAMMALALEAARRHLAEQSIPRGSIVSVLVEGEPDLLAARVVRHQRPALGPAVEVFTGSGTRL